MLGIGLGGFVSGLDAGMRVRREFDRRQEENAEQNAIEGMEAEAKQAFDEEVAAGRQDPDNFDNFFKAYAVPKMEMELLRDGDIEGAKKWREWADTEAAKKGSRLFQSGLLKLQTGDEEGALEDMVQLSKVKGYLSHDVDVTGYQPIQDKDGNRLGWRVTFKDGDGKERSSDFQSADLPGLVATYGNPQAAFQSKMEMEAEAAKGKKKQKEADQSLRLKAIKRADERYDGGLDGTGPRLADLPKDERERIIQEEMDLLRGPQSGPGSPMDGYGLSPGASRSGNASTQRVPGVIMDKATGERVPPPQSRQPQEPANQSEGSVSPSQNQGAGRAAQSQQGWSAYPARAQNPNTQQRQRPAAQRDAAPVPRGKPQQKDRENRSVGYHELMQQQRASGNKFGLYPAAAR